MNTVEYLQMKKEKGKEFIPETHKNNKEASFDWILFIFLAFVIVLLVFIIAK